MSSSIQNEALNALRVGPGFYKIGLGVPPRHLRLRDWAEKHMEVTKGSRPGHLAMSTNPVLGCILDVLEHPAVREVNLMKAVQTGGSLAARIFMAHSAHTDPSFALLVFPNQDAGKDQIKKYWKPVLSGKECPVLKQFQRRRASRTGPRRAEAADETDRTTHHNVVLSNGFDLLLGYSGSVTSLASHACKRVVLDEVDKYNDWDGDEAEPIDLARARTETFEETYKIFTLSTPTVEGGQIFQQFEASRIKLYPFCACRGCGDPVQLMFEAIRWSPFGKDDPHEPADRAALIEAEPQRVWIECDGCHVKVHESERRAWLARMWLGTIDGKWQMHKDGREIGTKPPGRTIAIHLPTVASSIGTSIVKQAAMWIAAQGSLKKIQFCRNQHHGRPFIFDLVKPSKGLLKKKCEDDPDNDFIAPEWGHVPTWASKLIMTVDTQKNKFYWVIRAWGARFRSRMVACGEAMNFEQLEALMDRTWWPNDDQALPARRVSICAIDSGGGIDRENEDANRTVQVYRWCARDTIRRVALKGVRSKRYDGGMTKLVPHKYQNDQTGELIHFHLLWVNPLDTGDVLANFQQAQLEVVDPATGEISEAKIDQWELNRRTPDDYFRHMNAMVRRTVKKNSKLFIVWVPEVDGARHDYHDLERYQIAVAHDPVMGCGGLPGEAQVRSDIARRTGTSVKPQPGGIRTEDGRDFLVTQR